VTHQEIIYYCMKKKGSYLDYPFSPVFPVIRVKSPTQDKGRIYAQIFRLRGEPKVTLNCTPEFAELYRMIYPGSVVRGWHCPPLQQPHFNTVNLDGSVPNDEILRMIDHAYHCVVRKYPKYIQNEIQMMEE